MGTFRYEISSGDLFPMLYNSNSHAFTLMITLDHDARRLIKRQKLSHPRFRATHGVGELSISLQRGVASQHLGEAGRQQVDEGHSLPGNGSDDDKPRATSTTITTSVKIGKGRGDVGRSKLRPMMRMVGAGSEMNLAEVRIYIFVLALG